MAQEMEKSGAGHRPARQLMEPFAALRSEMDRVFDSFLGRSFGRFPDLARMKLGTAVMPSVDVRDTPTEIVVEAELPGMDEKDITVTLNNGVLTLKGEKKAEREEKKENYQVMERSYGSFHRTLHVGDTVDPEKVKAAFEKGVLKITMPKRPEAVKAEKRIPIGKAA